MPPIIGSLIVGRMHIIWDKMLQVSHSENGGCLLNLIYVVAH